jgi:hypothetical protein
MIEPDRKLPTTEQLATLAATLVRTSDHDANSLAAAALTLWRAAEDELAKAREAADRWTVVTIPAEGRPISEAELPPLPEPKRYPIKRDEFARLVLPHLKGRTAELAEKLKAYCKACIAARTGRTATPEQVADYYANWKDITQEWEYQISARQFQNWWNYYAPKKLSEDRSEIGKKGAAARAAKKAAKKQQKTAKESRGRKKLKKKL